MPFVAGYPGILASRSRGWVDAQTAWPEPSEMLPPHRCPAYEQRVAIETAADAWAEWLDAQRAPEWVRGIA